MSFITEPVSKALGGIPIIGDAAKTINTAVTKPGDLVKYPMQTLQGVGALSGLGVIPGLEIGGTLGKVLTNPTTPLEKLGNVLISNATGNTLPLMTGGQGGGGGGVDLSSLFGMPSNIKGGDNTNPYAQALQQALVSTLLSNGGVNALLAKPSDQGYLSAAGGGYGALGNVGQTMLNQAYGGGLQNAMNQYATMTDANAADPYSLNSNQQKALNAMHDQVNAGRMAAKDRLRQLMAARGHTNPELLAAAMARIDSAYDNQLQQAQQQAVNTAYQGRLTGAQNLVGMQQALGGAGAGLAGTGATGLAGLGQTYMNRDLGWQGSMGSLFGNLMANYGKQAFTPALGGANSQLTPTAQQGYQIPQPWTTGQSNNWWSVPNKPVNGIDPYGTSPNPWGTSPNPWASTPAYSTVDQYNQGDYIDYL